ncbi:MAG: RNA polymerase sigma factor [Phycisphaerales bacterium]|nr:RNA polymerase sigma factor [Phycisphaerae bacterium]NNF44821.1 RNA polymerase sigma factor [Phycisphaerales bacterium]NNM25175.1 RNA polymerase sigma factor [Phycisphaerales bacterium]
MILFPTTVWTHIDHAGARDERALESFAARYRPVVLSFIRSRGYPSALAEDLCHETFLRVLRGDVLAKADRTRGRFRSLLLTITMRTLHDHHRKRRETPVADPEPPASADEPVFDHAWAWHVAERGLEALRDSGSPYYATLVDRLAGRPVDRKKLWIARRKLATFIRREIALTCRSPAEFEREVEYLGQYLRPAAGDETKEVRQSGP